VSLNSYLQAIRAINRAWAFAMDEDSSIDIHDRVATWLVRHHGDLAGPLAILWAEEASELIPHLTGRELIGAVADELCWDVTPIDEIQAIIAEADKQRQIELDEAIAKHRSMDQAKWIGISSTQSKDTAPHITGLDENGYPF